MSTGTSLPAAKDVRDMLEGLVGKPVAVSPGAPVTPAPTGRSPWPSTSTRTWRSTRSA